MGPQTSSLAHRFINMVACWLQPCSGKDGFETRPYICCSGTSTATINAPPYSSCRFQTCPPLKEALHLPFLKEAVSQIRNRTYEILYLVKLALPILCHRSPRQG